MRCSNRYAPEPANLPVIKQFEVATPLNISTRAKVTGRLLGEHGGWCCSRRKTHVRASYAVLLPIPRAERATGVEGDMGRGLCSETEFETGAGRADLTPTHR
jgi:hypothetical protein